MHGASAAAHHQALHELLRWVWTTVPGCQLPSLLARVQELAAEVQAERLEAAGETRINEPGLGRLALATVVLTLLWAVLH